MVASKVCSKCGAEIHTGRKVVEKKYWIREGKTYCLDCWNGVIRRVAALERLGLLVGEGGQRDEVTVMSSCTMRICPAKGGEAW